MSRPSPGSPKPLPRKLRRTRATRPMKPRPTRASVGAAGAAARSAKRRRTRRQPRIWCRRKARRWSSAPSPRSRRSRTPKRPKRRSRRSAGARRPRPRPSRRRPRPRPPRPPTRLPSRRNRRASARPRLPPSPSRPSPKPRRLRSPPPTTTRRSRSRASRGAAAGGKRPSGKQRSPLPRSVSDEAMRTRFHASFRPNNAKRAPMNSLLSRCVRLLMLALLVAAPAWQPAAAQEDEGGPSVLRDSETELLFKDISRPLIQAAGLDPNSVRVVLLNDPEINAFVATGQTVYIQTGLIQAVDNVNQLQGVIAHELGHVAGGHSIRLQEGAKERPRSRSPRWSSARWRSPPALEATPEWASSPPASRLRSASFSLSRAHRKRPPTRPARSTCPRPGSAARACSTSSASCRTRSIAWRSTTPTATPGPTRCRPSASRRSSRCSRRTRRGPSRSIPSSTNASSGSRRS